MHSDTDHYDVKSIKSLHGMTVLVTGANGFLGRHLIDRLKQHGAIIYAVSRTVIPVSGVQWMQGDLTNAVWLEDVVTGVKPDIIYQLASSSVGGQGYEFVLPTFENDLRCTVNTLLAARACACRVVLVASLEEPILDGRPITVSSPYAAAKASSTYYGLMFHQLYGLPVTVLRLFMTYGPGQKTYKVIPYTILSLLNGEPPRLSSGARLVDWVYVHDVIAAFIAAATAPDAAGEIIELGSGCLVSVHDVVQEIQRLIPGAPEAIFRALPDRVNETVRCAGIGSASRVLHWTATTPLSDGLRQTIEWYRTGAYHQNGWPSALQLRADVRL